MAGESAGESRPPIPEETKRQIRQRCGFGCVLCGWPLYVYHHVLGYAITKDHSADEITLLCDDQHREFHTGFLTSEQIAEAVGAPYNMQPGNAGKFALRFQGTVFNFAIGNTKVSGRSYFNGFHALVIDMQSLLSVRFEVEPFSSHHVRN